MFKNKLLTVLKATMTGQMNIFKFGKRRGKTSVLKKSGKMFGIAMFGIMIMGIFTMYAAMFAEPLHGVNLTYIVITLFALASTLLIFVQGIYQSQGILFDAKDSNLLFSMPIKKSTILASRLIKLLYFEYVWNLIIMVPTFGVYAFFEKPEITFYLTAIVVFICLPIVPMILSSIIGYIIQSVSSRFKFQKLFQMIFSVVFMGIIFAISFNLQNILTNIAANATSLNEILLKIYYPLGIYEQCILDFNITKLLFVLLGNVVIFALYILVFSKAYFKITSRLSEKHSKSNYKLKESKTSSKTGALFKKEIKRYFSSPIYVLNTIIGPVILILSAGYLLVSKTGFEALLQQQTEGGIDLNMLPKLIIVFLLFIISLSNTTCSAISTEGKNLWITKSLPVETKEIFKAKIGVMLLISVPASILSVIVYAIKLNMETIDLIYCLITSILFPLLVSIYGIIVNLRHPILNAESDTVIVKQGISVLISIFSGFILGGIAIGGYFILKNVSIEIYTGVALAICAIITLTLWKILNTYGVRKFNELNN